MMKHLKMLAWVSFKIAALFFITTIFNKAIANPTDSITSAPAIKKISIKPTLDFDQRFSYIRNKEVNIWGERVGLLINEKFKIGIGGYYLSDKLSGRKTINTESTQNYINRKLIFGTAYFEPFLYRKKIWELSIPFELGVGKSINKLYTISDNTYLGSRSKLFIPTGVGVSLSLKAPKIKHLVPLSWVGINFLAGYRYCLLGQTLNTNYNGAFWSVSGAIFIDKIYDQIKSKRKRK
jgi:hypothetical protein